MAAHTNRWLLYRQNMIIPQLFKRYKASASNWINIRLLTTSNMCCNENSGDKKKDSQNNKEGEGGRSFVKSQETPGTFIPKASEKIKPIGWKNKKHVRVQNPEVYDDNKSSDLGSKLHKSKDLPRNRLIDRVFGSNKTMERDLLVRQPERDRKEEWKAVFFSDPPLGLFSKKDIDFSEKSTKLGQEDRTIWDELYEEEMHKNEKLCIQNGFDEMIQLTKEGKLWHFPIDNEQGYTLRSKFDDVSNILWCKAVILYETGRKILYNKGLKEKKVPFHKHVFLDHLLEEFPKKGPIRHFMHLVVTGLSKNPHLTFKQKEEHIQWYKNYFKAKENVLVEILGEAGQIKGQPEETDQNKFNT